MPPPAIHRGFSSTALADAVSAPGPDFHVAIGSLRRSGSAPGADAECEPPSWSCCVSARPARWPDTCPPRTEPVTGRLTEKSKKTLGLDFPRRAHLAAEPLIGLLVLAALFLWIPF